MKGKTFVAGMAALCAAVPAVVAQSAAVSAGGEAAGQGVTFSYTVGQVAAGTARLGSMLLTEGVQQTPAVAVQRIDGAGAAPLVTISPNPTQAAVTLCRGEAGEEAAVTLLDGAGRTLAARRWGGGSLTLDLAALPAGVYMVRVAYGRDRVNNYKIIKR